MKFNLPICICVAAIGVLTNSALAFQCSATVHNVLVYSDGSVNVLHSGRGDYTVVCSLRGDRGVDVATCAAWTGLLQQVKKKGGTAQFYYPGEGSCSTMPTYWTSPTPSYIGDVTP